MNAKEKIQFLLDKGLSNSFIAKICNYHPSTLSKWLSGKISVSEKLEKNINQNLLDFVEELQKIIDYYDDERTLYCISNDILFAIRPGFLPPWGCHKGNIADLKPLLSQLLVSKEDLQNIQL